MIKPFRMPDGSIIFRGEKGIFKLASKFKVEDVVHRHFEVTAEDESIAEVDDRVESIVKGFFLSQSKQTDLAIAVSEAVNNSINQGPKSPDRKVSVDIIFIPKVMLYVSIRDDLGELKIEDINLDVPDTYRTDESGRGMLIMTHLCQIVACYWDDASKISSNQKEIILGFKPD